MMKKFIYSGIVLALTITSFAPIVQATDTHSYSHPPTASVQGATHHFEYHVLGNALSELVIEIPQGIRIRRGIEVQDESGKKLEANVTINDNKAMIVFSQPVPPNTTISVLMKGINTPGHPKTWQYRLYGKLVGINEEIPLGFARIQTYD